MQKRRLTIGIDASRAFVSDPAGPEYYSWHIIRNLSKIDKNNHYLLYLRPGQKPSFALPRNFETRTVYLSRFWTQVGLAWETLLNPPDVLFIPAHTLPLITRFIYAVGSNIKLLPQLPILVTVHGLEGKYLPQSGSLLAHFHRNWSIAWSVKFADHLIAVSNDTLNDVLTTYKVHQSNITMIHEGVDFEKFARATVDAKSLRSKYHINKNYILFVGTLQPRKNLVRLIKAFSILGGKYPSLQLVIAGKPGWLYEEILKAPKRFGVDDRVVFTGRIEEEDLPGLYKGARGFILPSLTEGFGLPILEAQASGTPVVSSSEGALKEVAGDAAIFVNPYKTAEITSAISKILEDKKLRGNLVKKGVKNAKSMSWVNTAYSTLKLLERLAA